MRTSTYNTESIVDALRRAKRPLTAAEVSERVDCSLVTVYRILNRLTQERVLDMTPPNASATFRLRREHEDHRH